MIALETQEAGTGRWFPIIHYAPGSKAQQVEADETADVLRKIVGLYVRTTDKEIER